MRRIPPVIIAALIFFLAATPGAFAFGEPILALSGQYTFFTNPCPGSHTTYYQKMVPCVAKETIWVPRKVVNTYPVPVASIRREPVTISETPVGCPHGSSDCVECAPRPSRYHLVKEVVGPRPVPTPITDIALVPRTVTRRVMLPQWFEVIEQAKPPKPIRKVGHSG